jgi:lipopolysaccharide export system permease protein
MKKLDKLILKSFAGPFILTFVVVVFILLMQYMIKYFDEIVGKGLDATVYAELLFYFSIHVTTLALPLAVLLSSLMTFGNLGEHFELTAIKSAGISLTRVLMPLLFATMGITVLAFINNDQIVPRANLNAYSLLYDIRQTKPSLSLQEGSFYNGIPNYSIKVNKKFEDEESLKGLIIYNHTKGRGNTDVILADSGRMYMTHNDKYLMLEMYDGQSYTETVPERTVTDNKGPADFMRNKFKKSRIVFSLESFNMVETKREYFASNRVMKDVNHLSHDVDSMQDKMVETKFTIFDQAANYNPFVNAAKVEVPAGIEQRYIELDSIAKAKELAKAALDTATIAPEAPSAASGGDKPITGTGLTNARDRQLLSREGSAKSLREVRDQARSRKVYTPSLADTAMLAKVEKKYTDTKQLEEVYKSALGQVRYVKNNYEVYASRAQELQRNIYMWEIEIHKKWAQAIACLVMFMIGAPLGAIIKRGGLGVPVIVSIAFFIIFYVFTMFGEKWAREGIISPEVGIWSANIILLPFGLLFLWQARNDARLFESDFYSVWISRFRSSLGEKIKKPRVLRQAE